MADPLDLKTPLNKTPPPADAEDLTGARVGRFVVRQKLGAGGMGQVYGAEDPTLKRTVALKRAVSKSDSGSSDHKRFLKEAQRASALNHPNIGSMYDVVEHGGELWLVMEYIEGETLRRRLKRPPISSEDFFTIATQCCEGLQAAHEKGIIHGDIKPENIMLTPNLRVKILDFGVARRTFRANPNEETRSMETMTASGGTPAYMAPEVLLQKPDDGRSDLFSLGLVFYEMLGGEQPFHSDSLATTVARIVHEEPPPLKNVPAPLAAIVTRMIEKNPERRYATAQAVLEDLRRVQMGKSPRRASSVDAATVQQRRIVAALVVTVAVIAILISLPPVRRFYRSSATKIGAPATSGAQTLPPTKILAVLPFTAANADPKLTALGQGLVESIAAKLGKLTEDRAFEVVPPGSLQDRKISTLPEAARMFGANLGLMLNLEPHDDLVKVDYSLVNAQSGATVTSDSITVPVTDAFTVEQNVAAGAIKALQLQLRPEEQAAVQYHGTDNATAYRYYLQAQGYLLNTSQPENLDNAALMAREALKLDPNFGMAKAVLGSSYWSKYSASKQEQWIEPAQTGCNEAVKLGNAGAAGHVCLGRIADGRGHSPEAVSEFQLALGLEPTSEEAAVGMAKAYEHEGKITEAEAAYQQAVQAHPNSRFSYNMFGTFYLRRNEYEKALQMYDKVIQIAPDWYGTYVNVGSIYDEMGQYEKAIDPLKKSIAIRPSYGGYVNLGAAYFGLKRFADAAGAYQEAAKLDPQQHVIWGDLGAALYYGGKKDQATAAHGKAIELALADLKVNARDPDVLSALAGYYSMMGDRTHALLYLGQALQYGHNDKQILIDAAGVYNQLGETGLAIEWLGKAVQAGYTTDKIRSDPEFANLENTPGYQQLTKSHP